MLDLPIGKALWRMQQPTAPARFKPYALKRLNLPEENAFLVLNRDYLPVGLRRDDCPLIEGRRWLDYERYAKRNGYVRLPFAPEDDAIRDLWTNYSPDKGLYWLHDDRPCTVDELPEIAKMLCEDLQPVHSSPEPEAVEERPEPAVETKPAPARFELRHLSDLDFDPVAYLIKGVLPRGELAVLYGPSGAGKSFVALDLAFSIAKGGEWRGRRVRAGKVVYVCAEGVAGFGKRKDAYSTYHGLALDYLPFYAITDVPNLLDEEDAGALGDAVRAAGGADLLIIDTLAQTTPGADENTSEDMGKAIAACRVLNKRTGATVMLVHHAGKDAARGARGWSGLKAAADVELTVEQHEQTKARSLRISKSKDDITGTDYPFRLETVNLGEDEDGDPITSCVAIPCAPPVTSAPGDEYSALIRDAQDEVAKGNFRESAQSKDWVGFPVARAVGLNFESDRKEIKQIIADWIGQGWLVREESVDEHRKPRVYIRVGKLAEALPRASGGSENE